jgi:hypothetical protein
MKEGACSDNWPDATTLEKLSSYVQTEEKEGSNFNKKWVSVETSTSEINTLFS